MKKKGALRRILPEVRNIITAKAVNTDKKRTELAEELELLLGDKSPTLDTLEREISRARNHPESPLDKPWSVGCLAQYEIPPDALPIILHIYEQKLRQLEQHFTVREALWIARLYKVIDDPTILERFAYAYASREKIDSILGNLTNTRGFDFKLLNYCNKDRCDEVVEIMEQSPNYLNPFPSHTSEEEEEVRKKLKQKGYDIKSPGLELLEKHVEQLWLEKLPKVAGEFLQKTGQKDYVMNPEEEAYKNWIENKLPIATEEFKKRAKQRKENARAKTGGKP